MAFADAMAEAGRPCELALYNWGDHGMLLGHDTLDVRNWPRQAKEFMESLRLCQEDPEGFRARYTHPYQAACTRR
jgi:acetyl esterase/lipase